MGFEAIAILYLAVCVVVFVLNWQYQNVIGAETVLKGDHLSSFRCAFCHNRMRLLIDFGWQALAGGFLKPEQFKDEKTFPLRLCFCPDCYAVQLADRVSPDMMFRNYFYFSSATESIKRHFAEYATDIVDRFKPQTAIEIGCNDGVLINPLRAAGVDVTGVDPSSTVPQGPGIVNEYFTTDVAERLGKVDVVIANNVFAHISDIRGATEAVVKAMKDDGVFVMEAHYLGAMLDGLQYDWVYHEHLYYYSLLALENHFKQFGLTVFDVKPVSTHGGSMRYYVCKDSRPATANVTALRAKEREQGLDRLDTFENFAYRVHRHSDELREVLGGKKIVGYGASGRANALIQFCRLDVAYIVDDAPAKHGYYTPGSHVPIYPRSHLNDAPPDEVVVFAWGYLNEIRDKCPFPLVVPLPDIKTISEKVAA